jgi:hypothetical protein
VCGYGSEGPVLKYFSVAIVLWLCMSSTGTAEVNPYGKRVRFVAGKSVSYPDFTIRFIGTRREVPKMYPRGWLVYDFEVHTRSGEMIKVAWSAGTGEIGPAGFTVGGREYFLELKATAFATDPRKTWLKDDEMIIWMKDVYLRKLEGPGTTPRHGTGR